MPGAIAPMGVPMLSPRGFLRKYTDLEVCVYDDAAARSATGDAPPANSAWLKVDVSSYRLGLKQAYKSTRNSIDLFKAKVRPHFGKNKDGIKVWVKTIGGSIESRTYKTRGDLSNNINDPFYGKGSPEEVQVVLQLAIRFGLFPQDKLQIYCNNGNIGLDCNGFVGNYLRHVVQGHPWYTDIGKKDGRSQFDGNTLIASIMKFGTVTTPVKTLADINSRPMATYLLALCDENGRILDHYYKSGSDKMKYGHIMISEPMTYLPFVQLPAVLREPAGSLGPAMTVLESAGGVGLVESTYYLLGANGKGAFEVFRGSKNQKMRVAISRLS